MNPIKLIRDFLNQEVPRRNGETVLYYKQAMEINDLVMMIYDLVMFLLILVTLRVFRLMPLIAFAAMALKHIRRDRIPIRINLLIHTIIICAWCSWYVVFFGWDYGGQYLMVVAIFLAFFSVYEPPLAKIGYFLVILLVRMILYDYSLSSPPLHSLDQMQGFFFQLVNAITIFTLIAGCCVVFSSNLQETERLLLLRNEQLQQQAHTDPLTGLYNRRPLTEAMQRYVTENPHGQFCIAIADIDFFKQVNDTYGHNCGDYVLKRLADLFLASSHGRYTVGRWGGEEFCFFIPDTNIDVGGNIINDLCTSVRKMELEFEGHQFKITLTAGLEENDFRSPLEELIDSADQKLYRGKNNGRDQVVI